jgi:hypothetical protein
MDRFISIEPHREPWSKGRLVGQKSSAKAQRHLGYSGASADFRPSPRFGLV